MRRKFLQAKLRERYGISPPPAEDFWSEFRRRAAMPPPPAALPIEGTHGKTQWARSPVFLRRAAAALLLISLMAALTSLRLYGPWGSFPRGARRVAAAAAAPSDTGKLSAVEDVDVPVDYASMIIVKDAPHGATLLWINGMTTRHPTGG